MVLIVLCYRECWGSLHITMGSLTGHIIPGVFLSIMGICWIITSIWNHITTNNKKPKLRRKHISVLQQRSWLPLCCCPNLPVEPILKILLCTLLLLIEVFFNYAEDDGHPDGMLQDQAKFHYITTHCCFILSGIVDLLSIFLHLPHLASSAFLSLAFLVEGIVFYLHHCTNIVLVAIYASFIFSVLRFLSATNLFINLGFGTSILLQGTWLIHGGYFLYGGFIEKLPEDDGSINFVKNCAKLFFLAKSFPNQIVLIFLFNLAIWIMVSLIKNENIYRRKILKLPKGNNTDECEELNNGGKCSPNQV